MTYFGMLLVTVTVLVLDFCLFSPLIPRCYAYSALGSMILYGAFLLRYTNTITLRDLTGGIGILYSTTALLLVFFGGGGFVHLLLAGSWVTILMAASTGYGLAVVAEKKWKSVRARRAVKWLAPAAGLASVAGCCLYDLIGFINSDSAVEHFSTPALECSANDLQRTKVVSELDGPVSPETNLIWSAPFQLAWNNMTDWVDEEIHFNKDEPVKKPP